MYTSHPQAASAPSARKKGRVQLRSMAELPTRFGTFSIYVFSSDDSPEEHAALVRGDVFGWERVTTRVHSECLTGDAFGSLRCDCGPQLEQSMREIAGGARGVVLYLRQEGRGIGLANKIRAYELQEQGLDTIEANRALGLADDARSYRVAADMLRTLGVRSIDLLTNNPDKVNQLSRLGVRVASRLPHVVAVTPHARGYLRTKVTRCGHLIDAEVLDQVVEAPCP